MRQGQLAALIVAGIVAGVIMPSGGVEAACTQTPYSIDIAEAASMDAVIERIRSDVTAQGFRPGPVGERTTRDGGTAYDLLFTKIEGGRPVAITCRVVGRDGGDVSHTCCLTQD